MKRIMISVFVAFFMAICGISFADVLPIPISAEQAFDAVQTQTDPVTGLDTRVALVDVRTKAEYYWVGAACQVDEIVTTDGEIISPDYGKVILTLNGRFLSYEINGHNKRLQVKKVSKMNLSPISLNIPYEFWDEDAAGVYPNEEFATEIESLADEYDVIIFLCRSGARSQNCLQNFDAGLFAAIYEIDQPDGKSGNGGFEGNSYSNVYNGYRGFPERLTEIQEHPSVSWKDAGLPMKTGLK
jgi:rhodanese-related sulfurtransferase